MDAAATRTSTDAEAEDAIAASTETAEDGIEDDAAAIETIDPTTEAVALVTSEDPSPCPI